MNIETLPSGLLFPAKSKAHSRRYTGFGIANHQINRRGGGIIYDPAVRRHHQGANSRHILINLYVRRIPHIFPSLQCLTDMPDMIPVILPLKLETVPPDIEKRQVPLHGRI